MIITKDSHVDHAISKAILAFIVALFQDKAEFFIETIMVPDEVMCGLYGPLMGDSPICDEEIVMEKRLDRKGPSRMISRPMRPTDHVTVIAGPHEGDACILYTAFGGLLAPKEPWDNFSSEEERKESEEFWAEHALSRG